MGSATTEVGAQVFGGYKPSLGMAILRGCSHCHSPHPIARLKGLTASELQDVLADPDRANDCCPDCGAPSVIATHRDADAIMTGFWGGLATHFLKVGAWLFKIANQKDDA